jgi:hypothetical protein
VREVGSPAARRSPGDERHGRSARGWIAAALLALPALLAPAAPAAAWEPRAGASREDFEAFHRRFAFAAYPYPRHGAAPLGITGFRVYAEATADRDFDEEPFYSGAVDGDLPGGTLSIVRVGARKGLPGGIDLGASYGEAVDGEIELISGELSWAILDGGAVSPALAVRVTGTQSTGGGRYDLDLYGAELELSKGFAVVTPYVGAGFYYGEGSLDRGALGDAFETDDTQAFVYAGVTLNLLLPKITVEVEQGEAFQGALNLAIGF